MGRTWEARVAEYVDSPKLACRVRIGEVVSCLIAGNYGNYRTRLNLRESWDSSCTCPYDGGTCKHIRALAETYKKKPRSFVDVDAYLVRLAKKPARELVRIIRDMAGAHPASLEALKIKGFKPLPEPEENSDGW